ncbi:hypothetical protein [Nocardia vinacea]|uniref:hypothetical protein n=1 Tax=Nocardia vinacea TaxID=96468 RepID=UPI0012F63DF6|nr:hypothetical protein [Nocardia vinacea]
MRPPDMDCLGCRAEHPHRDAVGFLQAGCRRSKRIVAGQHIPERVDTGREDFTSLEVVEMADQVDVVLNALAKLVGGREFLGGGA